MNRLTSVLLGLLSLLGIAQGCGYLDLIVVVDSSSQVGSQGFHNEVQFLLSLAVKIGLSPSGPNMAGIVYSSAAETNIFLPFTSDPSEAVLALNNLTYYGNSSAPGTGLWFATNETSGRSGASRTVLFLSGSYSNEGFDPITEANQLKNEKVLIVGLGAANCDVNTLQKVVSGSKDYFYVSTWVNAASKMTAIINAACANAPSTSTTGSTTSPYTNTGPGSVTCGDNECAPYAQCCSDDEHPGSDFYCCPGEGSCCLGQCCAAGQLCTGDGNCVSGGGGSSGNPYTTTGGSQQCGYNLCAGDAQCCSDDEHPGSDYYCCTGSETCCGGVCCGEGWNCNNGSCQENREKLFSF